MPGGDGTFQILQHMKQRLHIDLSDDKYSMSNTFNVSSLSPFHGDEHIESRMAHFQGLSQGSTNITMPFEETPSESMTRARATAL